MYDPEHSINEGRFIILGISTLLKILDLFGELKFPNNSTVSGDSQRSLEMDDADKKLVEQG